MDLRACRAKYRALASTLTERSRRVWAATEARALGRGGIALVARATGISTSTIARGLSELRSRARVPSGRVRRPGGGRKRTIDKDPTLLRDLEGLVEPTASGAPNSLSFAKTSSDSLRTSEVHSMRPLAQAASLFGGLGDRHPHAVGLCTVPPDSSRGEQ